MQIITIQCTVYTRVKADPRISRPQHWAGQIRSQYLGLQLQNHFSRVLRTYILALEDLHCLLYK